MITGNSSLIFLFEKNETALEFGCTEGQRPPLALLAKHFDPRWMLPITFIALEQIPTICIVNIKLCINNNVKRSQVLIDVTQTFHTWARMTPYVGKTQKLSSLSWVNFRWEKSS